MSIEIIFDGGSCHEGDYNKALELAQIAKGAGADAIKFQLCHDNGGNIPFREHWIDPMASACKDMGINFFCSVWDSSDTLSLAKAQIQAGLPVKIKIAYSMRMAACALLSRIDFPAECYITSDIMTTLREKDICPAIKIKKLWTYTIHDVAVYPVHCHINLAGIFPLFDGFSDHTMGWIEPRNAVLVGAKIIEKHLCLDRKQSVPDARFALEAHNAKAFVKFVRGSEGEQRHEQK